MPYNYLKAKQSGANDDQIQKELYDHGVKYNLAKARAAGATDDQIGSELSKSTQGVSAPAPVPSTQQSNFMDSFKDTAKNVANAAVSAAPTVMGTISGMAGSVFGKKGQSIGTGAGTAAGQVVKQAGQQLLRTESPEDAKVTRAKEIGINRRLGQISDEQAKEQLAEVGITSPEQLNELKGRANSQAIKPLVEGTEAGVTDYALNKYILPAAGKILKPIVETATAPLKWAGNLTKGAVEDFVPKNAPEKLFSSAFTIPRKIAERLNIPKMSAAMNEYGINGGLEDLANVAKKVTGPDGAMSRAVRESLDHVPGVIDTNTALEAANSAAGNALNLDDKVAKKTLTRVANIVSKGGGSSSSIPGKSAALDIWDSVKALEKEGYGLINKSTDLSPNPAYEQQGQIFLEAANSLKSQIDGAQIPEEVFSQIKNKYAAELAPVSKALSKKVMNATNVSDLRAIASDFVNLDQAVRITEEHASTPFQKAFGGGSKGLGGLELNKPATYLNFITDRPSFKTGAAQSGAVKGITAGRNLLQPFANAGNAVSEGAKKAVSKIISPLAGSIASQQVVK